MPRGEIVLRKEVKRLGDSARQVSISHSLFSSARASRQNCPRAKQIRPKQFFSPLLCVIHYHAPSTFLVDSEIQNLGGTRLFIGAVKILLSLRDISG
jgi:hypothetical protein